MNRTQLKNLFKNGCVPTEADYANLIESTALKTEVPQVSARREVKPEGEFAQGGVVDVELVGGEYLPMVRVMKVVGDTKTDVTTQTEVAYEDGTIRVTNKGVSLAECIIVIN